MFSAILPSEQVLRVKKRDFRDVNKFDFLSDKAGYVLTGSTGSGKSTFGLLPVLKKMKRGLLMIQPTQANCGNIMTEFTIVMPDIVRRNYSAYDGYPMPSAGRSNSVADKVFTLTTVDEFRSSLSSPSYLQKYDVVVLDEYHLISQAVFDALAYLRSSREYVRKYILVSATPGKTGGVPSFGEDVQLYPARFPLGTLDMPMSNILRSVYNCRHFLDRGNGCVVVVMPNKVFVDKYRKILYELGVQVFVIDSSTTMARYREIQRLVGLAPMVVLLDPSVEAGITIKMSVLINPGYTYMIRYDGCVVSETYRALSPEESMQRAGRAGRGICTQYIYNTSLEVRGSFDPTEYLVANTYIMIKAHGHELPNVPEGLLDRFSKLRSITAVTAREIMKDTSLDPVVAAYKYSETGRTYKECGGNAEGFFESAANDLKVYYFKGGYVIAPVFTLVNLTFDPYQLVHKDKQAGVLTSMVAANSQRLGELTTSKRVEILRDNIDVYISDFVVSLQLVLDFARPSFYTAGGKPATLQDILNDIGYDVASLFEAAARIPGAVLGHDEQVTVNGVGHAHWLNYSSNRYWITPKEKYVYGGKLRRAPFVNDIIASLKDEINVAALATLGGKSVNLEKYRSHAPEGHQWYSENVLKKIKHNVSTASGSGAPTGLGVINSSSRALADTEQDRLNESAKLILDSLQPVEGYSPKHDFSAYKAFDVGTLESNSDKVGYTRILELVEKYRDKELSPDEHDIAYRALQLEAEAFVIYNKL